MQVFWPKRRTTKPQSTEVTRQTMPEGSGVPKKEQANTAVENISGSCTNRKLQFSHPKKKMPHFSGFFLGVCVIDLCVLLVSTGAEMGLPSTYLCASAGGV